MIQEIEAKTQRALARMELKEKQEEGLCCLTQPAPKPEPLTDVTSQQMADTEPREDKSFQVGSTLEAPKRDNGGQCASAKPQQKLKPLPSVDGSAESSEGTKEEGKA